MKQTLVQSRSSKNILQSQNQSISQSNQYNIKALIAQYDSQKTAQSPLIAYKKILLKQKEAMLQDHIQRTQLPGNISSNFNSQINQNAQSLKLTNSTITELSNQSQKHQRNTSKSDGRANSKNNSEQRLKLYKQTYKQKVLSKANNNKLLMTKILEELVSIKEVIQLQIQKRIQVQAKKQGLETNCFINLNLLNKTLIQKAFAVHKNLQKFNHKSLCITQPPNPHTSLNNVKQITKTRQKGQSPKVYQMFGKKAVSPLKLHDQARKFYQSENKFNTNGQVNFNSKSVLSPRQDSKNRKNMNNQENSQSINVHFSDYTAIQLRQPNQNTSLRPKHKRTKSSMSIKSKKSDKTETNKSSLIFKESPTRPRSTDKKNLTLSILGNGESPAHKSRNTSLEMRVKYVTTTDAKFNEEVQSFQGKTGKKMKKSDSLRIINNNLSGSISESLYSNVKRSTRLTPIMSPRNMQQQSRSQSRTSKSPKKKSRKVSLEKSAQFISNFPLSPNQQQQAQPMSMFQVNQQVSRAVAASSLRKHRNQNLSEIEEDTLEDMRIISISHGRPSQMESPMKSRILEKSELIQNSKAQSMVCNQNISLVDRQVTMIEQKPQNASQKRPKLIKQIRIEIQIPQKTQNQNTAVYNYLPQPTKKAPIKRDSDNFKSFEMRNDQFDIINNSFQNDSQLDLYKNLYDEFNQSEIHNLKIQQVNQVEDCHHSSKRVISLNKTLRTYILAYYKGWKMRKILQNMFIKSSLATIQELNENISNLLLTPSDDGNKVQMLAKQLSVQKSLFADLLDNFWNNPCPQVWLDQKTQEKSESPNKTIALDQSQNQQSGTQQKPPLHSQKNHSNQNFKCNFFKKQSNSGIKAKDQSQIHILGISQTFKEVISEDRRSMRQEICTVINRGRGSSSDATRLNQSKISNDLLTSLQIPHQSKINTRSMILIRDNIIQRNKSTENTSELLAHETSPKMSGSGFSLQTTQSLFISSADNHSQNTLIMIPVDYSI
eukprot:403374323